jgi:hypothetical protein
VTHMDYDNLLCVLGKKSPATPYLIFAILIYSFRGPLVYYSPLVSPEPRCDGDIT